MKAYSIQQVYTSLLQNNTHAYFRSYAGDFFAVADIAMEARQHCGSGKDPELAIIPGSFNPLHNTHKAIYDSTGVRRTAFELSISEEGKPPMDLSELSYRLDQFEDRVVLITNAPRMMHKIAILREWNLSVHMGMDAFLRMVDEYGIIGIGAFRANFIVVDRIINGARHSYPLAQRGHKPPNVHSSHLSHSLPEEMLKVSSAEIRKQMEGRALELTKAALKALKN